MFKYEPMKDGAVVAIRIYFEGDRNPMAQLAFTFGGTATINWVNVEQRKVYESGINGYTLIYDERPKKFFQEWVR